jgi:predicted phosphate transport protein (TIGR00153 family)
VDILFRRTRHLERQIDEYLDLVVQGGLVFKQGMRYYLAGRHDEFEERLARLDRIESKADELRRGVENELYTHTLIPESRGDVLGLLESSDKVLNQAAFNLKEYSIERPTIPESLRPLFLELVDAAIAAQEAMVLAVRAYFRNPAAVRDHVTKTLFNETESDRAGERFRREVFAMDLELSHKSQMRHFALRVDSVADLAEDVCDRLAIAVIKRSL